MIRGLSVPSMLRTGAFLWGLYGLRPLPWLRWFVAQRRLVAASRLRA